MVYKRFYRFLKDSANFIMSGHACIMSGHACVFCNLEQDRRRNMAICSVCQLAIERRGHYCYQCGFELKTNSSQFCGSCLKKPKPYRRLIATCDYQFPINNAIGQLKFNRQLHIGKALSHLLSDKLKQAYQEHAWPDALVPIPLHRKRLAERGFNQSLLISKFLSESVKKPLLSNSLIRVKNTSHQIGLKAVERRKNLKGAFQVKQTLPKHIALIDDVVTTGATISEATKICLKHGAEQIDIWCLAKT